MHFKDGAKYPTFKVKLPCNAVDKPSRPVNTVPFTHVIGSILILLAIAGLIMVLR